MRSYTGSYFEASCESTVTETHTHKDIHFMMLRGEKKQQIFTAKNLNPDKNDLNSK